MDIIWSDLARTSLFNAIEYVASKFGERTAFTIRTLIQEQVDNLSSYPNSGVLYQLESIEEQIVIKYLIVKRSKIFYTEYNGKIIILLIWDTRRNPLLLEDLLLKTFYLYK
jgi:plasmid stabilization system protein ParE